MGTEVHSPTDSSDKTTERETLKEIHKTIYREINHHRHRQGDTNLLLSTSAKNTEQHSTYTHINLRTII